MRKQWQQFLEENASQWSYGIVPALVEHLDSALNAGDVKTVCDILHLLSMQGVVLDTNGHLRFALDFVL